MARVLAADGTVEIKLNALEKVLALRRNISIPVAEVRSVAVVDRPWDQLIPDRVSMGFAAATAPGRTIATVGPRARSGSGRALVVVYRNRPSIVMEVDPARTDWSLIVVSVKQPESVLDALEQRP